MEGVIGAADAAAAAIARARGVEGGGDAVSGVESKAAAIEELDRVRKELASQAVYYKVTSIPPRVGAYVLSLGEEGDGVAEDLAQLHEMVVGELSRARADVRQRFPDHPAGREPVPPSNMAYFRTFTQYFAYASTVFLTLGLGVTFAGGGSRAYAQSGGGRTGYMEDRARKLRQEVIDGGVDWMLSADAKKGPAAFRSWLEETVSELGSRYPEEYGLLFWYSSEGMTVWEAMDGFYMLANEGSAYRDEGKFVHTVFAAVTGAADVTEDTLENVERAPPEFMEEVRRKHMGFRFFVARGILGWAKHHKFAAGVREARRLLHALKMLERGVYLETAYAREKVAGGDVRPLIVKQFKQVRA